jgi:predicted aspartyl protease
LSDCNALTVTFAGEIRDSIILDAEIIIVSRREKKRAPVKALIDTGATGCCINESLAKSLGMRSVKTSDISTAGGIINVPTHTLDVRLSDTLVFRDIEADECADDPDFDFVIGMSVLSAGDMAGRKSQPICLYRVINTPAITVDNTRIKDFGRIRSRWLKCC